MNDIFSAIAAMRAPVEERGAAKWMPPIIIAIVIGLLGWVGTTLSGVGGAVATLTVQFATLQKSVDELSAKQTGTTDKIADLQSRVAQHDLRLNAIEQDSIRTKERIRIVEGQKPLSRDLPQ